MTSEYPYPGQPGPDDSGQGDAYDAPPAAQSRPPFQMDGQMTPFAAFGEAGGEPPSAPKSTARAAARVPGIVGSPDAPPPPPPPPAQRSGGVYGAPGGGAVYGSGGTPDHGQQQPQPGTYGAPDSRVYGQPYGEPDARSAGQQPAQPSQYQQPQYDQGPVQQAARPAVPTQRAGGAVYGSRPQTAEPDPQWPSEQQQPAQPWQQSAPRSAPPAQQWPSQAAPQSAPPAQQWPSQAAAPQSAPPYPQQRPAYGSNGGGSNGGGGNGGGGNGGGGNEPGQFEQHGRRTQGPGGYSESPSQRSIGWQDQLQPLVPNGAGGEIQRPPAPPRPAPADVPVVQDPPKSKLRVLGYVVIVLVVIGLGVGALYYTSRTDPPKVGSCVTQSGTVAVNVSCSQSGAYKVVSKVSKVSDCQDYLNEPSLSYRDGGKDIVLCLEPAKS